MSISEPIRHRAAQTGEKAHPDADNRSANQQPPVNEDILDALHVAAAKFFRLGNGALAAGEIDDFRDGEDAEGDEHQIDAFPEVRNIERVTLDAGFRVQADG